jgi:hypothetical protein
LRATRALKHNRKGDFKGKSEMEKLD